MSFQLTNLNEPPLKKEFRPYDGIADGEGLMISININLINLARMEEVEIEYQKSVELIRSQENADVSAAAVQLEIMNFKFRARMLGGKPGESDPNDRYIADWNLFDKTKKIPVSYETFLTWDKNTLDKLYNFVLAGGGQEVTKKN